MMTIKTLLNKFCSNALVVVYVENEKQSHTYCGTCKRFLTSTFDNSVMQVNGDSPVLDWRFRNETVYICTGKQWGSQLPPGYCRLIWDDVIEAFDSNSTPRKTMETVLNRVILYDLKQTFAVIAKLKPGDERISSSNRDWLSKCATHPVATTLSHENPMFNCGLDTIHTTHIDQMIDALYKIEEEQENE